MYSNFSMNFIFGSILVNRKMASCSIKLKFCECSQSTKSRTWLKLQPLFIMETQKGTSWPMQWPWIKVLNCLQILFVLSHKSKGSNKRDLRMKESIYFFMNDAFKILDKKCMLVGDDKYRACFIKLCMSLLLGSLTSNPSRSRRVVPIVPTL